MKKNMIFQGALSVMTALLLCTSCSSDDLTTDRVAPVAPVGKVIHYTATVGEGDETRATLDGEKKYVFQTGDKLVITGTGISGELTLATGAGTASATFSGDLTYSGSGTPADGLTLNAVLESTSNAMTTLTYASATYPSTAIASASTDIAARQAAVEKYSYFTATSTYAARSFTVNQQTSFLDFTVTFEDGTTSGTEFTIDIKNDGSTVRTGSVETATDSESGKVVAHFVAAMPKGTVMSSATVQLGTKDAISFGGSTELAANKIYNISKTVAASGSGGALASVTADDIGKVIGANGQIYASVTAAQAAGTTACAIIAYVGSATGEASPYTHGLAIAMKDANSGSYCYWSPSNSDESLTNYKNITAVTTSQSGLTNSKTSGFDNATNYPAFYHALHNTITEGDGISKGAPASGTTGWFLPSMYQWNQIVKGISGKDDDLSYSKNDNYKASALNTKITAAGGTGLQADYYWSATEFDYDGAWGFGAYGGDASYGSKDYLSFVRAVFAF